MFIERLQRHLFPTTLVRYQLPDLELCGRLTALVLERSRTQPSVPRGERTGWQSGDDLLTWNADTQAFGELLALAVMGAHDEAPLDGLHLAAWGNLLRAGDAFSPHTHANAAFSGVFFADAGDSGSSEGGLLCLRDPRAGAAMVITAANRFDSACVVELVPATGVLYIFPSWLLHWVSPYRGARPRVSISFNAR